MSSQFSIAADSDDSLHVPPNVAEPRVRLKRRRVLVIEDSESDYFLLSQFLKRTSDGVEYELDHAACLADGLKLLSEDKYHVILLDLGLPDGWGLDCLQRVLATNTQIPVIVLTGVDDNSVATQAVNQGASDFLTKGVFDSDLLLRSIDYARIRRRIQNQLANALEAAQSSEANLHNIIRENVDGMIVIDRQGTIMFSNRAAQKLLNGADPPLKSQSLKLPEQPGEVSEFDLVRANGESTPVEARIVLVEWEGRPAHLAILRDLTRQKQSEADRRKREAAELNLRNAEREIEIARDVQQSLFPSASPTRSGFDIAGAAFPTDRASGDYFDFVEMPNGHVVIVVGDVSGHGLGPAMMMVQTRTCLHTLIRWSSVDPGEILTHANELLTSADNWRFVTLFFGILDPRARTLNFAAAGHRGYLIKANGDLQILDATGPALGITVTSTITRGPVAKLASGDVVLLPTDGIDEAHGPDRVLLGVNRMLDIVRANRAKSAREIIDVLYQSARAFTQGGPQLDDITAVVVKVL